MLLMFFLDLKLMLFLFVYRYWFVQDELQQPMRWIPLYPDIPPPPTDISSNLDISPSPDIFPPPRQFPRRHFPPPDISPTRHFTPMPSYKLSHMIFKSMLKIFIQTNDIKLFHLSLVSC